MAEADGVVDAKKLELSTNQSLLKIAVSALLGSAVIYFEDNLEDNLDDISILLRNEVLS